MTKAVQRQLTSVQVYRTTLSLAVLCTTLACDEPATPAANPNADAGLGSGGDASSPTSDTHASASEGSTTRGTSTSESSSATERSTTQIDLPTVGDTSAARVTSDAPNIGTREDDTTSAIVSGTVTASTSESSSFEPSSVTTGSLQTGSGSETANDTAATASDDAPSSDDSTYGEANTTETSATETNATETSATETNTIEPCASGCWIDGSCFPEGAPHPGDLCAVCRTNESQEAWSPRCLAPSTCVESDGAGLCVCPAGFTGVTCERCLMYVNQATGDDENDGRSWSNAFATVATALPAATANGCEIWVAEGTYYPAVPGGNARAATFALQPGVDLYGGFDGDEVTREQREVHDRVTVLSGDLSHDDNPEETTSYDDNAYHVVTGANDSTLDGFTITAGFSDYGGGGMYNISVSPLVVNCTFEGNFAERGAAVYAIGSSSTFDECRFTSNVASANGGAYFSYSGTELFSATTFASNQATNSGGGLVAVSGAEVGINGCRFEYNAAGLDGGAINASSSGLIIQNSSFMANEAEQGGGAISATGASSSLTLSSSAFYSNAGVQGGALALNSVSLVQIFDAEFSGNSSSGAGGAIYLSDYMGAEVLVVSANIHDNFAHGGPGGAVFAGATPLSLVNSLVHANSTTGDYWDGGGIFAASGSTLTVHSSTFKGNSTANYGSGGAIHADETSNLIMRNSISWGNAASESPELVASQYDIRYCDVQGLCVGQGCTNGNLNSDPLFVAAGDLRLSASSPAIDAGDATLLPLDAVDADYDTVFDEPLPVDLYRNGRVYGSALDLGALESQPY